MDEVALTGMKFFNLTRSVVISVFNRSKILQYHHIPISILTQFHQVAGTIVTYELILLQFNKADKVNDCYEH